VVHLFREQYSNGILCIDGEKRINEKTGVSNPMMSLSFNQMYKVTLERNEKYDGVFYVGVITTKIFCLPSCKARKPLARNIVFFENREDAVFEGFRGCKRCRADFFPDNSPYWFNSTYKFLKKEVERKLTEKDLVQIAGVNISTIRRYFKSRFNISPLTYHRKLRLQHARKLIETGNNYLAVSSKCGFKSSSGFRKAFIKEFGFPPGRTSK
jgi:AraC family transcriptional regulator of adaptative response/methylated-DNA-[protein]-cysteine methyltransferase